MLDACHHAQPLIENGSFFFGLGWTQTMILLISASQVARIIDTQLPGESFKGCVYSVHALAHIFPGPGNDRWHIHS
jgi:hypothetical protein